MAYITREDGEHFVIPSYRDVLSVKQKSALKKEILSLSQSYGEYATLQKKGPLEYEVAFSPDTGYLLGESIWHHFNRPLEMIYCEAIPNTTDAILVIVKAGSVYLDGSFPLESINDELVIFLTQQNNFEVYTFGDVPISQTPQEGKFSFEADSVKSYTVLDAPVFPTLLLLKSYQLRLVQSVLKEHGIGVLPIRKILLGVIALVVVWTMYSFLSTKKEAVVFFAEVNPYEGYNTMLLSPAPDQELEQLFNLLTVTVLSIPGWEPTQIEYTKGVVTIAVQSSGSKIQGLLDWAAKSHATIDIKATGIYVGLINLTPKRSLPSKIFPLKDVIADFVDRLADVYPGNHIKLTEIVKKDVYKQVTMTISIGDASPAVIGLIAKQFRNLPVMLQAASFSVKDGTLTGTIIINALGS